MSSARRLRRRDVLALLTGLAGFLSAAKREVFAKPADQGIGGTGAVPPDPREEDRGIGGTGVVGTIRKFGSIYVNDLHIRYPKTTAIFIDGEPAHARDLKLGQVVRVVAQQHWGVWWTDAIHVANEVAGVVEQADGHRLVVAGQTVSTKALKPSAYASARWTAGDMVAVSGLRKPDGTIVASLIETRATDLTRIAGPVAIGANGELSVGGATLKGANPAMAGGRGIFEGHYAGGVLDVTGAASEQALLGDGIRHVLVEAYAQRDGDSVVLGSGLRVEGKSPAALPAHQVVRTIVSGTIGADGILNADQFQLHERVNAPGPDGSGGGAHGPHGTGGSPGGPLGPAPNGNAGSNGSPSQAPPGGPSPAPANAPGGPGDTHSFGGSPNVQPGANPFGGGGFPGSGPSSGPSSGPGNSGPGNSGFGGGGFNGGGFGGGGSFGGPGGGRR